MYKIHMQKTNISIALNQVWAYMYLKTDNCTVLEVDVKLLSTVNQSINQSVD